MRSIAMAFVGLLTAVTAAAAPTSPTKVILIGIDGVSLNVLDPYIEQGIVPNLAKLAREGTRGHLESYWPQRTPQVWTSAVTGKLPGQHGIWDHVSNSWPNPPGVRTKDKRVVTSRDRKSKALWNLLDAKGMRTLVVGWMVTHPPEKLKNGVIAAPIELKNDKRQTTIKGSFYSDAPDLVQPTSLWPEVRGLITDPDSLSATDIAPFADVPPAASPLFRLPYLERYTYALKWSLARARSVEAITLGLLDDATPEVVLSYFQCPDTMGHRFWIFKEPLADIEQRLVDLKLPKKHAAELKQRFGRAFEACLRDVDERVGRILEATRGPETLVLVVSDHGFGHCERPHPFKSEPFGGVHLDQGFLLAAGPGVGAGKRLDGFSLLDVAPTILHVLGEPVADDMRGKVARVLFEPGSQGQRKERRIKTYESVAQTDSPWAEGYPIRKGPLRPSEDQKGGRNPYK